MLCALSSAPHCHFSHTHTHDHRSSNTPPLSIKPSTNKQNRQAAHSTSSDTFPDLSLVLLFGAGVAGPVALAFHQSMQSIFKLFRVDYARTSNRVPRYGLVGYVGFVM
jgi:hypothetical protein